MAKILFLGFGAIAQSFFSKLITETEFNSNMIYCVDADIRNESVFCDLGGKKEHFHFKKLDQFNYESILEPLNENDYFLDFATDIKNLDLLNYVIKHKIHYLSLADSSWIGDSDWLNIHQHFLEYKKIHHKQNKNLPTTILQFGMNPGLVSCFVKQCLIEIVDKDNGQFVSKNREYLKQLVSSKKFNVLAKKLKVRFVVEVDNDNQIFDIVKKDNIVYSPWCPPAFRFESISAPEISFGTKKLFYQYDEVCDCDFKDYFVSLPKPSIECEEVFFSPQGEAKGYIAGHEEIFTIGDYLSYGRYKPTVLFIYSPCDLAIESVKDTRSVKTPLYQLVVRDELLKGGESVGIIIQGENFTSRYYGNYLDSAEINETATVLQVSGSAMAAFKYMLNHPNEGILLPEDLDIDETINYAKKYLKTFISCECPDMTLNMGK